jgi:NhaA family Na+:H+ antiporter
MEEQQNQKQNVFKQTRIRFRELLKPVENFIRLEQFSGIILLVITCISIIVSNSNWGPAYAHFLETPIHLHSDAVSVEIHILHWVNDGLMFFFFLVVGLEIKREILTGELSSWQKAALPVVAATGGMLIPALIYIIITGTNSAVSSGWGIPMATDIGFTMAVLSILRQKVPFGLKIFLMALAIADDMGAVLVIAFFYTKDINYEYLYYAIYTLIALFFINRMNIRQLGVYFIFGFVLWVCILMSGVHATIAGVLLSLAIPSYPLISPAVLTQSLTELPNRINAQHEEVDTGEICAELQSLISKSVSPSQQLTHQLHFWVTYVVMPIFAAANTCIILDSDFSSVFTDSLAWGIMLGLFIGKPAGVFLFTWAAVKLKMGKLPPGVSWMHLFGGGILTGIGFTMSIFISALVFDSSANYLFTAKVAILLASLFSGVIGFCLLLFFTDNKYTAITEDEVLVPSMRH